MRTTVVIPAYRAWSTLPLVLNALAPQIGPEREVLLVDSGVAVGSAHRAQGWPWLRAIEVGDRLSPGGARNAGAAQASGDLLAFLDADAVPCPGWLEQLERALSAEVDAVAGAVGNGTPESRTGTAEHLLLFSEVLAVRPRELRHGPSVNLLVRREYFDAAGGFCERLRAGEDSVFTYPLARGRRLAFAPDAIVEHLNRTRLGPFLTNQRLQGAAFVALCDSVPYPNRWVSRGPALALAGPLRLLALARFVRCNSWQVRRGALRALPQLLLGTAAWVLGAVGARLGSDRATEPS